MRYADIVKSAAKLEIRKCLAGIAVLVHFYTIFWKSFMMRFSEDLISCEWSVGSIDIRNCGGIKAPKEAGAPVEILKETKNRMFAT